MAGLNSIPSSAISGTLDTAKIPDLDAAKITGGTLPVSRGGTGTTSSTGSGALVLKDAPAFTGDATFDTNTLKIDASNNRVGIGTSTPGAKLHIKSADKAFEGIAIFNPSGGTGGTLNFSGGVRGGILISNGGGGTNANDNYSSQPIVFYRGRYCRY